MNQIRVRFAPSPTGFLHIGGLRTALYDYLFAKHNNGKCILRIEDTDQKRKVEGAVENLLHTFQELGLAFDEGPFIRGDYGPYFQSERLDIYQKYAEELVQKGFAYYCFCTPETLEAMKNEQAEKKLSPKYDRRCLSLPPEDIKVRLAKGENHVIRLKMPDEKIFIIDDLIRGKVEINSSQSDDQVLIKADGFPTYHLASVVDDHLMNISHVIRGEEWLSSTPKHLYLYECFGWEPPVWVHLPLILNPDRSKLSKRMNDVSVESYLEKGYLKEAILNFVALLGWRSDDEKEIYSLEELIKEFTLEKVNKAGAVFDLTKLDWMNGYYIRNLPLKDIAERCKIYFIHAGIDISDEEKYLRVIEVARNYITTLPQILSHAEVFYKRNTLPPDTIFTVNNENTLNTLRWFIKELSLLDEFNLDIIKEMINRGKQELQLPAKQFYHPLYLALLYAASGPNLAVDIYALGKNETLERLKIMLNSLISLQ